MAIECVGGAWGNHALADIYDERLTREREMK